MNHHNENAKKNSNKKNQTKCSVVVVKSQKYKKFIVNNLISETKLLQSNPPSSKL